MRFISYVVPALLVGSLVVSGQDQKEDVADQMVASVVVVSFHSPTKPECKAIAATVAKVQAKQSDKPVLFVQADVSGPAQKRQATMLLNALGIHRVWRAHKNTVGKFVVVNLDEGEVVGTFDAKTKAEAVLKVIEDCFKKDVEEEEIEEEDGDDDGCGCGCGEDDDG